jgi:ribosomal 50S subunit-associated protein YjgA (DUF615 family)
MRKPRDFESELKALFDKARVLKERRVRQLGELVTATGADALDTETLAGVLLAAVAETNKAAKEGWRRRGAGFFQDAAGARRRARAKPGSAQASDGEAQSGAAGAGAQ